MNETLRDRMTINWSIGNRSACLDVDEWVGKTTFTLFSYGTA